MRQNPYSCLHCSFVTDGFTPDCPGCEARWVQNPTYILDKEDRIKAEVACDIAFELNGERNSGRRA